MKITRWILAGICLLLPIAARWLWYYQGTYQREAPVATPDFAALTIPQPALSTPLPTPQPPIGGDAPLVVVDMAHGNAIYLAEIDPLLNTLRASGCQVTVDDGYGEYLADLLKKADAYVVLLPTSTFDNYTIQEIERFVSRGGRLLVAVDPTRLFGYSSYNSSTEIANLLLAPYGLAFNEDYAYNLVRNESNFRHLILEDFIQSPLTDGLQQVIFYSAQSLSRAPQVLITGDSNTLSSLDDQGGALALAGSSQDGHVIAIGDMTFMTIPYLQVADNQLLMNNLVRFLRSAGDERVHDLLDYPYWFDHDVVIIAGEDFKLDQDRLSLFGDLQVMLRSNGFSVRFGEQAVPGQDAIYLSPLPPQDPSIASLVSSLGITYKEAIGDEEPELLPTPVPGVDEFTESSPDTEYEISVPGFSKFSSSEFGLLIYQPGPIQNQLYILGANDDAILDLAQRMIGDGLTGCAVLENIAVCPVEPAEDSDSLDDWSSDYDYDYDYTEPTPTPVG